MKLYRCVVKMGHVGSGKYMERPVFVWARNVTEAMNKAKRMAGVKKGHHMRTGSSVLSVEIAEDQE